MKTFKKFLAMAIIIIALISLSFLYREIDKYTLDGTIIMVCNEHWVMVETEDSNVWEFDGYGYFEGQKVKVTLRAMDTPSKIDDEIVDVY